MTSSNGNIFRVTGHLYGPRWVPRTNASDAELWCFFICVWMNGWVNNRKAGDFRRYRAHHDVIVMESVHFEILLLFYWPPLQHLMMASWHGNDFCTKSTGSFVGFPHRRPVMRIIDVCFAAKLNSWTNHRILGDWRHLYAHVSSRWCFNSVKWSNED